MQKVALLGLSFGAGALVASGVLYAAVARTEARVDALEARITPIEDHAFALVSTMGQYQRFAEKLYFAGEAEHWELAEWYAWKLNRAMNVVMEGHVGDYRDAEEYDVSKLTAAMLKPTLEALYPIIEARDLPRFRQQYALLVQACNACHAAAQHPQVRIILPTASSYPNQSFSPDGGAPLAK